MTAIALPLSILIKATFIAAIGMVAAWMARGKPAAFRHTILAATFATLLALPIACVAVPAFRISIPARTEPPIVFATPVVAPASVPDLVETSSPVPRSTHWPLSAYLELCWIAGVALFLAPVIAGLWQIRLLRRSARPWSRGQTMTEALSFHRPVDLLLHGRLRGPMTCGILHPAVVLPREAEHWADDDLNRAMIHELEHVRRADWLTQCMARVICAAYWFHPLVWIAWRKLVLDAERSCDDAVLGRSEATAYANQLVDLAKKMSTSRRSPVLAMASRADLQARVKAMLDAKQPRGRAGRGSLAFSCVVAGILVLAISPLTLVEAQQPVIITKLLAPISVAMVPPAIPQNAPRKVKHALAPVGIAAAPQAPAANSTVPNIRFMARTALVEVTVVAVDKDGNVVEGLQASDFTVKEDDTAERIAFFEFKRSMPQDSAKSYYVLGYYSTNPELTPQYRRIDVTVGRGPVATIDYRKGYYASRTNATIPPAVGDPPRTSSASYGDMVPPRILRKQEAEYSEEGRKAKWQGIATVSVDIDDSGNVTAVQLIRALGLGLDQKAIDAVKQWRFTPAVKDGKPIATQAIVDVSFRLP